MTVNKDEKEKIREKVERLLLDDSLGAVGNKYPADYHHELKRITYELLEEDIPALLASDDANAETIRQQAAEIERLKSEWNEEREEHWKRLIRAANSKAEYELHRSEEARKAAEARAEAAERDNTALRECLAWYADTSHYSDSDRRDWYEIFADSGERARTLLAELDRKDTQPKEEQCDGNGM